VRAAPIDDHTAFKVEACIYFRVAAALPFVLPMVTDLIIALILFACGVAIAVLPIH
jgi:hypothetical protein